MAKDAGKTNGKKSQNPRINEKNGYARFQMLFDNMPSCVAIYRAIGDGTDFVFSDVNKALELVEKVKKEDVVGRSVKECFPYVEKFGLFSMLGRVWRTGRPEHLTTSFYVDERVSGWKDNWAYKLPSGEIVCIYEDVTEKKDMEEKLRISEYLLKTAGKMMHLGGWSVDLEDNKVTWSDEVAAIHEMPEDYSSSVEEGIAFYAPEYRDRIKEVFNNCVKFGIPYDEEMQIITSSGKRVWVRTLGEALTDNTGRICRVQGAFQDVSALKKTEEERQKYVKELEVFRKASVGREERILDLKSELRKIKEELKKTKETRS